MNDFTTNILKLTQKITEEIFNLDNFQEERKAMICKAIDLRQLAIKIEKKQKLELEKK